MTISTEVTKITYQANGSTTAWSFSFPGGPDPDIRVFITQVDGTLVETTAFTLNINPPIAPNPTSIGGSVIFPTSGSPLAVGQTITIARDVPLIQPTALSNQSILYPEIVEKALDYIVEEVQQLQEQIDRSVLAPITETNPIVFPPCPQRKNKFLAFDDNCNPVAIGNSNPITSTNGVRVPNTEIIPELPSKDFRPGTIIGFNNNGDPVLLSLPPPNLQPLLGQRTTIAGTHTVNNLEKGFLFQLAGNIFYDFILGDPTTYDADFSCAVFNADIYAGPGTGRAKRVMFNGTIMPGGLLWPGQWLYIFRFGNTWVSNPRDQRWKPGVQVTFFVDPVAGNDDGTSDGLATGAGAAKTIAFATNTANARVDYGGIGGAISGGIIQLAQGTYDESVLVNTAAVGGTTLTIKGADDGVDPTPWVFRVASNSSAIHLDAGVSLNVKGIGFVATGTAFLTALLVTRASLMTVNNCRFGNFATADNLSYQIHVLDNSVINLRDIFIVGNSYSYVVARRNCTVRMSGALTVNSGLTFGVFIIGQFNCTFVGGGTAQFGALGDFHLVGGTGCAGTRYLAQLNSSIIFDAGVADTLPGNLAGGCGTPVTHGTDSSLVW